MAEKRSGEDPDGESRASGSALADGASVERMVKYLREIRDHFEPIFGMAEKVPEKWRKQVRKMRILAKCGILAVLLVKGGAWYYDRQKIHKMASRYAQVAERLYFTENNPDVALPFLDKALSLESENPEFIFRRAYMKGMSATRRLLNLGRPFTKDELDAAHAAYAEALFLEELEPERPEPYILQGQILSALQEGKRARAAIEKAVSLNPQNDFAHLRMAMVQLDEGDVSGAEKSLDRALELNPKSKWAWLWKGVVASERKGDQEAARSFCDRALAVDPKFDMAHYNRGWTFARGAKRDYGQAREEMRKALAVNPAYKEADYAIGYFYGCEDNYTVAKVWMDRAIALDETFLVAHKWRGIICGEMGENEEAIASFDRAILLDPTNADLYVRRAKMFGRLGRAKEQIRDLVFANELAPRASRTLLYLGDAHLQAQNPAEAVRCYDEALAVNPKCDDAFSRKANALVALSRADEALAAVDSALAVSQYKPERFWLQKGGLLEKCGRPQDALSCYVKARTLNPKLAPAWRREAELQKGRDEKARRTALVRYLGLVPTDETARAELSACGAPGN